MRYLLTHLYVFVKGVLALFLLTLAFTVVPWLAVLAAGAVFARVLDWLFVK